MLKIHFIIAVAHLSLTDRSRQQMAVMESLPYLIFGIMSGTSGLLMLLTPETLQAQLPDTVEQAEHMKK